MKNNKIKKWIIIVIFKYKIIASETENNISNDLVSCIINISIDSSFFSKDNTIFKESITLNKPKNTEIIDLTKDSVIAFNELFQNKKYLFKLNENGIDYRLEPTNNSNIEINRLTTIDKFENKEFNLKYSSQDILIGFKKKNCCEALCLII